MARKKSYDASDIEVLSGTKGIRANIGMYLGKSETQVLHAFREIYENAVDVFIKEMNDFVSVVLETIKDKKTKTQRQVFTVIDRGPGIPIEKNKETGLSTLTTVFTTLHSGSNFDKSKKGKAASRGKHGVGSAACVACSEVFTVYTCRDEQWYTQTFEKGEPTTKVTKTKLPSKYKKYGAKKDCGTVIEFTPDYTVLPNTIIPEKELFDFIKQNATLNSGLKVRFISDKIDETIYNKKGIITVLDDYVSSKKKINLLGNKPFIYEDDVVSVACQWSDLEGEHILSYVNSSQTVEGGSHVQGLFDTITKEFKAVAKRGADFTASDLREGLIAVIHYRCTDDDYSGQNKEKLNSPSATGIVKNILSKPLAKWIKKNSKLVREISLRATRIKEAKAEARALTRAASNVIKSSSKKGQLLGSKLIQCNKKCKPEDIELFLVEGNSASGSANLARDPFNQEILKCRGKGLNVFKSTVSKALANQEISSLLVALGAEAKAIKKEGTVSKFRIGKILLFSDPDIDALHIDALWLTWIYKFAPLALKHNMVYKVNVPLYQATWREKGEDKRCFGYSLDEIYEQAPKSAQVTRFKGLGELTYLQLKPFMDKDTRNITLITLPEAEKKIKEFIEIMGDDVKTRKMILGIKPREEK